ncbi:hypothetical protein QQ045_017548 [Rhodiola kirilowii]
MMDPVTSTEICGIEKFGRKDSQENMDGIRSTMVQQETLFKEQVQALHRLYKVQKMEMQELNDRKSHLTFETAELIDGFSSVSGLEERSGELVRPVARVYRPETGLLSLHPFCSLKLFEGGGSASFGGSFQRLERSPSKLVRDFDLESFPVDWVDESAIEIQPNDCSPTSKESQNVCTEECKREKANDASEDGLSTNWSGKVVSGDTAGNEDSSHADPIARKVKLSHQDSFASVNGCQTSSSSEGEENSKIAALMMTERLIVAGDGVPKMKRSHNDQTPSYRPQCCYSTGHCKTFKTSSKDVEEHASAMPDNDGLHRSKLNSEDSLLVNSLESDAEENENTAAATLQGLPLNKTVQQLPGNVETEATEFHASSIESSNLIKRKHASEITGARAGFDELMKLSKYAKRI